MRSPPRDRRTRLYGNESHPSLKGTTGHLRTLDTAKDYKGCLEDTRGPEGGLGGHAGVLIENIPKELRRRPQWVMWRLQRRADKKTKVPYICGGGGKADTTELMTWRAFGEAVQALQTGRYEGIGFVFCSADPFVGVDLDECRNPETGEIAEWAQNIIDTFTDVVLLEASPSGRGVHLITKGTCKDGINTKSVEVYGQDRFFTVTGQAL